jgi:hypothetical protein
MGLLINIKVTLKMEAAGCSETPISYKVIRHHGAKDNLYIQRLENLVSCQERYRYILNVEFLAAK